MQRYVFTLQQLGYLIKDPAARYTVSPKMLELVHVFWTSSPVYENSINHVIALAEEIGESVHLVVRDGANIVFVYRTQRKTSRFPDVYIGASEPAFCSAGGRALLAFLTPEERDAVLAASLVHKFQPKTSTSLRHIRKEIEKARRQGWCVVDEEAGVGEVEVASPILDADGRPSSAVVVALDRSIWSADEAAARLGQKVRACAAAASRTLGGSFPR